ncbi:MAG: cytochrome P450 [Opitutaceae bacterium]|nr:cytochrome P450 [Opitutaceae bacterium]
MEDPTYPASDPFRAAREERGVLDTTFQGKKVPMILGYKDVRAAAADWKTFSSDAPFRVPIPSEEDVRSVRQLPVETNPPEHTEYRSIIDPFFRQAREPEMVQRMDGLICELLDHAARRESIEVVRELALPLQSRALTYLLRMPESAADEWISWGIHVFRDGGNGEAKGVALERYIQRQLDRAAAAPSDDFFSALNQATYQNRLLTRDEKVGFANLTFAGGRDTIIQMVASIIGTFGSHPELLRQLQAQPDLVMSATEEFLRFISPLTHLGRVCPHATDVKGVPVEADERVSLCFASANRDATIFENPDQFQLDRKPNPHVAFGSGPHLCIGALHARLIVRTLLRRICDRLASIEILHAEPNLEREAHYERRVGYETLTVKLHARA